MFVKTQDYNLETDDNDKDVSDDEINEISWNENQECTHYSASDDGPDVNKKADDYSQIS